MRVFVSYSHTEGTWVLDRLPQAFVRVVERTHSPLLPSQQRGELHGAGHELRRSIGCVMRGDAWGRGWQGQAQP